MARDERFPLSPTDRYIVRSPNVRGGHARVDATRIGAHDVIGLLQNGETVDSLIGTCLPILTKAQVYECLAYYEDHRGEIDLLVARQMVQAQQGTPIRSRALLRLLERAGESGLRDNINFS